jgi:mRNA-degrading endonuclease RelE of RelBE toxin-antitoxin system
VSYRLDRPPEVVQAIERLFVTDPDGARLVAAAILALAEDPRPDGVHVLNHSEGLHRIGLSRLDPVTRRTLQYRVMYRIHDDNLVVVVIAVGKLPPAGRRR